MATKKLKIDLDDVLKILEVLESIIKLFAGKKGKQAKETVDRAKEITENIRAKLDSNKDGAIDLKELFAPIGNFFKKIFQKK